MSSAGTRTLAGRGSASPAAPHRLQGVVQDALAAGHHHALRSQQVRNGRCGARVEQGSALAGAPATGGRGSGARTSCATQYHQAIGDGGTAHAYAQHQAQAARRAMWHAPNCRPHCDTGFEMEDDGRLLGHARHSVLPEGTMYCQRPSSPAPLAGRAPPAEPPADCARGAGTDRASGGSTPMGTGWGPIPEPAGVP
jgi:hypothetical protein